MRDGKVRPLRGLGKGLGPGPDRCEDEKKETMTPLPVPVEAAKGAVGRPLAAWWVRSGGGQPGERAWTPDPDSRNHLRGEGTPAKVTWDPKASQGNLPPGYMRGEGTLAKATWHPERSRESRAAAQGWGTPQAFRAPAWPLPPSRKPGRSVGGSNQLWHFDPPFDLHLRDARHVGGGPSAPCAFSAGSPLAPFGPCPDPRRAQPGPP